MRDPFARKIKTLLLVHCHHSLYTCCYPVVSCCSQFSCQSQTGRSANTRNFPPAYQASPGACVVCMCTGVRRIRGVKMSHLVVNLCVSSWLTLLLCLSLLSQFRCHILNMALADFNRFCFCYFNIFHVFSSWVLAFLMKILIMMVLLITLLTVQFMFLNYCQTLFTKLDATSFFHSLYFCGLYC